MPEWCGPSYTIGIRRAESPNLRIVNVAIEEDWSDALKETIRYHVLDLLPAIFHKTTGFRFETCSLERLASSTATTHSQLDTVCHAKNFFYYYKPTMGDSVGVALGQGDDHSTSTLGPCLMINNEPYWLVNLHPLEEAAEGNPNNTRLILEHPSSDDRMVCEAIGHEFMRDYTMEFALEFALGEVVASSGKCTRTRESHNPYWEESFIDAPKVIMDWALCSTATSTTNFLRGSTQANNRGDRPVVNTMQPEGGAAVSSIGRTSGFQRGQIGMCPDLVSKKITKAEENTMEWFIEEAYPYDDQERFIESGIGVPGDSGAAVVDEQTGALVGQLWGRNKYKKQEPGPRVSYFTPVQDLFDDIKDRFSLSEHPRLPQLDDGSILPSARPACYQCVDIQLSEQQGEIASPELDFEDMTPPEHELLTPGDVQSPDFRRQQDFEPYQAGAPISFDQKQKGDIFFTGNNAELADVETEVGGSTNSSSLHSGPIERKRIATEMQFPHVNKRQRSA